MATLSNKREVEILLEEINVPVLGIKTGKQTSHLVGVELVWPRVGVAKKSAEQGCTLISGQADMAGLNWGKRIVMRETFEGHCAMRVSLTEDLDDEELEKLLRYCGYVMLGLSADAVEDMLPVAGKAASAPIDYLAKSIKTYPGAKVHVEGLVELDASDFQPGESRLLTVQMFAARTLLKTTRRTVSGQIKMQRKAILRKGDPDGYITLRMNFA